MRDYGKIPSRFWIDDLGRKIRTLNMEAKLIAPYLMTCTHSTMIGVYYLPITLIAHELGITLEGTIKGLHSLFEVGYCTYDERSEYIWVHDMALSQVLSQADTSLKPNDNRVKSINETYQMLPELPFLKGFLRQISRHISSSKSKRKCEPLGRGFEVSSKPETGTGAETEY